jgi:hypothetical protein
MFEYASDEAAAALLVQLERAQAGVACGAVHPVAIERARELIRALASRPSAHLEERLPGWMAADPASPAPFEPPTE